MLMGWYGMILMLWQMMNGTQESHDGNEELTGMDTVQSYSPTLHLGWFSIPEPRKTIRSHCLHLSQLLIPIMWFLSPIHHLSEHQDHIIPPHQLVFHTMMRMSLFSPINRGGNGNRNRNRINQSVPAFRSFKSYVDRMNRHIDDGSVSTQSQSHSQTVTTRTLSDELISIRRKRNLGI